jgi:hypothetical protein
MTNRRVRRPHGELVQHAAVVDWQRWSEGGWATSAPARCVGVGPVAPPQNALGVHCDERLQREQHVPSRQHRLRALLTARSKTSILL